ncbi:hypothetical protein PROFUN_14485 [Planoprotostelium fungivorum]|uniref:F-box domain-containing protein n=1 Tax=Planoprotostelium fungivorum TaxID=1890364 RepID=A0A2P6N015_9EUKA|nr:hypothetical protein PROFUN_14485 [Planoprotostelium fungivorum]
MDEYRETISSKYSDQSIADRVVILTNPRRIVYHRVGEVEVLPQQSTFNNLLGYVKTLWETNVTQNEDASEVIQIVEEGFPLLKLPEELLVMISIHLDRESLDNLRMVCRKLRDLMSTKQFWHSLVVHKCSEHQPQLIQLSSNMVTLNQDQATTSKWLQDVSEEGKYRIHNGEFFICHMNDRYWTKRQCDTAPCNPIAYLNSVCWLEIRASIPNVRPAVYDVIWCMMMDSTRAVKFKCEWTVKGSQGGQLWSRETRENFPPFLTVEDASRESEESVWCEWTMGRIRVDETQDVTVGALGGNDGWFGGWGISHIDLVPVL